MAWNYFQSNAFAESKRIQPRYKYVTIRTYVGAHLCVRPQTGSRLYLLPEYEFLMVSEGGAHIGAPLLCFYRCRNNRFVFASLVWIKWSTKQTKKIQSMIGQEISMSVKPYNISLFIYWFFSSVSFISFVSYSLFFLPLLDIGTSDSYTTQLRWEVV